MGIGGGGDGVGGEAGDTHCFIYDLTANIKCYHWVGDGGGR